MSVCVCVCVCVRVSVCVREGGITLSLSLSLSLARAQAPARRTIGTPLFVAPEILVKGKANYASDYWSFGVLIYVLIVGFAPFMPPLQSGKVSSARGRGRAAG